MLLLAAQLCGLLSSLAVAQEKFPSQAIELLVTFGPGGGADRMARKIAPLLEPILGQPLVISNVTGASGNVGLTKLLTNPRDGYTIATLTASTVSSWAWKVGYASLEDFTILAITESSPAMLFVTADSPFKSAREFLDHAQANPGRLRVATSGYGTLADVVLKHLGAQGYEMRGVPFAVPEDRYASLSRKRADALYEEPGDVRKPLHSSEYRPLVVFASERHRDFQDVPAAEEFGLRIPDVSNFRMLVVATKTPPERVRILREAIDKALQTRQWLEYCLPLHSCVPRHSAEQARIKAAQLYDAVKADYGLHPAR
jgi:tripartite-type tricarboxylate transporter receptor subunit TctC